MYLRIERAVAAESEKRTEEKRRPLGKINPIDRECADRKRTNINATAGKVSDARVVKTKIRVGLYAQNSSEQIELLDQLDDRFIALRARSRKREKSIGADEILYFGGKK